jgi:hypothetical protein
LEVRDKDASALTWGSNKFCHLTATHIRPQIEDGRSLSLIETCPVKAASLVDWPAADINTATWGIDANYVSSESGQEGAAQRGRDKRRDLNDAKAVKYVEIPIRGHYRSAP